MKDNQNTLEDTIIEDIDEITLDTLDESLEQDQETEIAEAKKVKKEDNVGEDDDDDDDDDDDGEDMDKPGDEDSDVDNDGDSDEADDYLKNRRKAISKNMKEDEETELDESYSSDLKVIAKKLGLSDAEVNKLEIKATKQYSKAKGQTMLVNILKAVDNMSGPFRKAAMNYAKGGDFGMLDLVINDRDEDMDESYSSDDIDRLIESEEGLTEEFKEKASIIFEAAVSAKVSEIEATLQEQYETRLSEETETIKSTLEEQVDNYLTYAVESWMEDNKVAIESSLRTQMAENFIGALKNVFVEHYVEVPENKVDLFDQIEKENLSLKEEAAKVTRVADALADRVNTLIREKIIAEAAIGLADTQADKLNKLVEDIEFVDETTFAKKVATIKEFYINGKAGNDTTTLTENTNSYVSTETIIEEGVSDDTSPEMKAYLTALSRMSRAMTADLT